MKGLAARALPDPMYFDFTTPVMTAIQNVTITQNWWVLVAITQPCLSDR